MSKVFGNYDYTPVSVNYRINKACSAHCRFCFATFRAVKDVAVTDVSRALIDALAKADCEKLNFAGGEPTLCRDLGELLRHAKSLGLLTRVMVDPDGRFFGNSSGQHVYSEPILGVGVQRALGQVGFVPAKFETRGGRYAW